MSDSAAGTSDRGFFGRFRDQISRPRMLFTHNFADTCTHPGMQVGTPEQNTPQVRTVAGADPPVFISYSSKDKLVAEELEKYLARQGIPAFRDQSRLVAGDEWDDRIAEALTGCTV